MDKIRVSADVLMRQAPSTAQHYLIDAVTAIDKNFGAGYSKNNPELVGTFMMVCAMDFATAVVTSSLQEIAESIQFLSSD